MAEAPGRQTKGYADFVIRDNFASPIIFIHAYKKDRLILIFEDGVTYKTECRAFTKNDPGTQQRPLQ